MMVHMFQWTQKAECSHYSLIFIVTGGKRVEITYVSYRQINVLTQ